MQKVDGPGSERVANAIWGLGAQPQIILFKIILIGLLENAHSIILNMKKLSPS